jgi:hypothetical protein
VARAALDGLDAARLLDQARRGHGHLQALDGIGPFYSS